MAERTGEYELFQQTFLGSSITNFSISVGWNSNPSTLSVNLINDDLNKRDGNAVDEGYHLWQETTSNYHGFPDGIDGDYYKNRGDAFFGPPPGSPAYFKYYTYDSQPEGICKDQSGAELPDIFVETDCVSPNTWSTTNLNTNANGKRGLQTKKSDNYKVFEFNGIIKSYQRDQGTQGESYAVSIEDPTMILEGTNVVLSGFVGTTAPADGSYLNNDVIDTNKQRILKDGGVGFYNVLNAFGYYENVQFGLSESNDAGMSWYNRSKSIDMYGHIHYKGVVPALDHMLRGYNTKYDPALIAQSNPEGIVPGNYIDLLEPFGGPIYYGGDYRLEQRFPATMKDPNGNRLSPHRYVIDITSLYKLHKDHPESVGSLPDDFRLSGEDTTLLSLIQQICEAAGADFIVDLVDPADPQYKNTDFYYQEGPYSGVIRVRVIGRDFNLTQNVIKDTIDKALKTDDNGLPAPEGDWANRIVSTDVGYEFNDRVNGVMMLGAPRTRVVGVTPMGYFKDRSDEFKNPSDPTDFLTENAPSTEMDGVTLWGLPADLSDDQSNFGSMADQFYPWWTGFNRNGKPKSLTVKQKLQNLNTVNPTGSAGSYTDPFTHSDESGMIDLYPVWGYHKRAVAAAGSAAAQASNVQVEIEGSPIIGSINSDDPYRDFDWNDGFLSIVTFVNNRHPKIEKRCLKQAGYRASYWEALNGETGDPATGVTLKPEEIEYLGTYVDREFAGQKLVETLENATRPVNQAQCEALTVCQYLNHENNRMETTTGPKSGPEDWHKQVTLGGGNIQVGGGQSKTFHDYCIQDLKGEILGGWMDVITYPCEKSFGISAHNTECPKYKDPTKLKIDQTYEVVDKNCFDALGDLDDFGDPAACIADPKCTYNAHQKTCIATNPETLPKSTKTVQMDSRFDHDGRIFDQFGNTSESNSHTGYDDKVGRCTGFMRSKIGDCYAIDDKGNRELISVNKTAMADHRHGPHYTIKSECLGKNGIEVGREKFTDIHGRSSFKEMQFLEHAQKGMAECRKAGGYWLGNTSFKRFNTADIPIDLSTLGFQGGVRQNYPNFYYASVTELRHAASSLDSWYGWLKDRDPWLLCHMGWEECPLIAGWQTGGLQALLGLADFGNIPDGVLAQNFIANQCRAESELMNISREEFQAMQKQLIWKEINKVATEFYGKVYAMPLPYRQIKTLPPTTPTATEFPVQLDDLTRIKNDDTFMYDPNNYRIASYQYENKWDIANEGWPGDTIFNNDTTNTRHPQNQNFFSDDGNLQAFLVYPYAEELRLSGENQVLNYRDISPEGTHHVTNQVNRWLGGNSYGKSYVKASVDSKTHFLWDKTTTDIHKGASPTGIRPFAILKADNAVRYSKPDSYIAGYTPRCLAGNNPSKGLGEFMFGGGDDETPFESPGDFVEENKPQNVKGGVCTCTDYISEKPNPKVIIREAKNEHDCITRVQEEYLDATGGSVRSCEWEKKEVKVDQQGPEHEDPKTCEEFGGKWVMVPNKICIPLVKTDTSRHTIRDMTRNIAGQFFPEIAIDNKFNYSLAMSIVNDTGEYTMVDAAYKPWAGAVPQRSNRYSWGPWAHGIGYGRVEFKVDGDYHPATFGNETYMNRSAIAKLKSEARPETITIETGSVTLTGAPAYGPGTQFEINNPNNPTEPDLGPYITDMSVDITDGGIQTTYSMKMERRFGELNEVYDRRLRNSQKKMLELRKDMKSQIKYRQLPDPKEFDKGS